MLQAWRGKTVAMVHLIILLLTCLVVHGAYAKKAECRTPEELIRDLSSPYLKARVYAAIELRDCADKNIARQAIPGLIKMLDDRTPLTWTSSHYDDVPESEMQSSAGKPTTSPAKEAAQTLGKLGDHRATSPLIGLLRVGVPYEQEAAIKALAAIEGEDSFDVLVAVFEHFQLERTSEVAQEAMCRVMSEACTKRPMDLTAARRVMSLLQDDSQAVRIMGMRVLGDMHEPLAIPLLSKLAQQSGDSDAREAASEALRRIRESQSPPAPWKVLALGVVLLFLGVAGAGFMIRACRKDTNDLVGCGVILSIILILMIGLGCVGISRFISAVSLNRASSERNLTALMKNVYSGRTPYPGDRGAAVALVEMADDDVIKALAKHALGSDPEKRTIARWMLARILAMKKASDLERVLTSDDPQVRKISVWVRREMRDPPISTPAKRSDPLTDHTRRVPAPAEGSLARPGQ